MGDNLAEPGVFIARMNLPRTPRSKGVVSSTSPKTPIIMRGEVGKDRSNGKCFLKTWRA